jgi:endonuclease-8
MCEKCREQDIVEVLSGAQKPVGELLLDQSVLSGIGNVAKSEALFLAEIHPETEISDLTESELSKLAGSITRVMWDSYKSGGRWTRRVYRRLGERCFECGTRIIMIRQGKQNRSTYLCPKCQLRP